MYLWANVNDSVYYIVFSFFSLDDQTLFGWSLVNSNDKELVVTSDPLDAIAVNQSTKLPAVSIPFMSSLPYVFSIRVS